MKFTARVLPGVAALAVALGLAGCSPSNSTAGSSTTTTRANVTTTSASSSTTSGSTTSSTAAGLVTCLPNQLTAEAGMSNGAAGTIEMTITMTNTSTVTCTMDGYAGMQLLSASGASLPTNVVRGGGMGFTNPAAGQPAALVTLAPNQSAAFSLSYEDVPVGTATSCPTSAKSEITPPNDTGFLIIAFQADACGGGTIHVSPVYANSAG